MSQGLISLIAKRILYGLIIADLKRSVEKNTAVAINLRTFVP
jgi:hypothetical protein